MTIDLVTFANLPLELDNFIKSIHYCHDFFVNFYGNNEVIERALLDDDVRRSIIVGSLKYLTLF